MSKRRPRKPRGKIGTLRLGKPASYIEIRLPDFKADIEKVILQNALAAAAAQKTDLYALTGPPIQNGENDFDFTLPSARGDEYLDLMEVAPLHEFGGSYDKSPQVIQVGELARMVYDLIAQKSSKYPRARVDPIHLRLYSADRRLALPPIRADLACSLALHPHACVHHGRVLHARRHQ